MDVVGAYFESLLGKIVSPIYMEVPQRLKSERIGLVCCILQSLYRLNQAGRLWNKKIVKFFSDLGFVATNGDQCILLYKDLTNNSIIMVGIYVEDCNVMVTRPTNHMISIREHSYDLLS